MGEYERVGAIRFLGMCTRRSVKAGDCPTGSGRSSRGIVKRYSGVGRDVLIAPTLSHVTTHFVPT